MGKADNALVIHSQAELPESNFQGLPRLSQDVFFVAVALYIPHVWIDSLCIIQDDPGDWKQESVKMGAYYRQASFTIASTVQNASEDGLFSVKPPRLARLPYRNNTGARRGNFCLCPRPSDIVMAVEYKELHLVLRIPELH